MKTKRDVNFISKYLGYLPLIGLILLMFFLMNLPLSEECKLPKVKFGTTCCVPSEKFNNMICVEEEESVTKKVQETYNKSIMTDGSMLKSEKGLFSFYPTKDYYLTKDLKMYGSDVAFYLFKWDSIEEICEIRVSYVWDYPIVEEEAYQENIDFVIGKIENSTDLDLISKEKITTKTNIEGDSFTMAFKSTHKQKGAFFRDKQNNKLVTFSAKCNSISENCQQCISEFDEMILTFEWKK